MQEIISIETNRKNGLYDITEAVEAHCEITESPNKNRQGLELSPVNKVIRLITLSSFGY